MYQRSLSFSLDLDTTYMTLLEVILTPPPLPTIFDLGKLSVPSVTFSISSRGASQLR